MKHNYFFLLGLIGMLFFSCNKNDDNNDDNNPPAIAREWFKLKTITGISLRNANPYRSDSTSIIIDSANNKIIFKRYDSYKDTSTETYTYNSKYQLELYEHVDTYDRLYISRMQFVRNADGQLTKVLSEYKNSLMATSEGTFKYDKRGDTTFITFLDSAKKHPEGYPDAQDYDQVALVDNRVAYSKNYSIKSAGNSDSTVNKYEYDAAGNLISITSQFGKSTPIVYTYQRGSETARELQKFIEQWGGDVVWFSRAKLFSFLGYIGSDDAYLTGNVLQSIKRNNVTDRTYTNEFELNGNLKKTTYQLTIPSATYTYSDEYKYWP
jgi:hypothetical protein